MSDAGALTQARLKELLWYNPGLGVFYWKRREDWTDYLNKKYAGKPAGNKVKIGPITYHQIKIKGVYYLSHRLVWVYMYGSFPPDEIDHKDGDGLNNKLDNLRAVSHEENLRNRAIPCNSTTGVCGVSFSKATGKYAVEIGDKKLRIWGGRFSNLKEAEEKARKLYAEAGYSPTHGLPRDERSTKN